MVDGSANVGSGLEGIVDSTLGLLIGTSRVIDITRTDSRLLYLPFEKNILRELLRGKFDGVSEYIESIMAKINYNSYCQITSILVSDNKAYYGSVFGEIPLHVLTFKESSWNAFSLESFKIPNYRSPSINTIVRLGPEFNDRIVVGGQFYYGDYHSDSAFFSDINGESLIPPEEFRKVNITNIFSIIYNPHQNKLFLDVERSRFSDYIGIVPVIYHKGENKFELNTKDIKWYSHLPPFLPSIFFEKGRLHNTRSFAWRRKAYGKFYYEFPKISNVPLKYFILDDGRAVIGTKISEENDIYWSCFDILGNDPHKGELVLIAGRNNPKKKVGSIWWLRIDYHYPGYPEVAQATRITDLPWEVYSVAVVRKGELPGIQKLHKRLLGLEERIKTIEKERSSVIIMPK